MQFATTQLAVDLNRTGKTRVRRGICSRTRMAKCLRPSMVPAADQLTLVRASSCPSVFLKAHFQVEGS